jgi:hypothetical protein
MNFRTGGISYCEFGSLWQCPEGASAGTFGSASKEQALARLELVIYDWLACPKNK